jgi:hypothetical protein
MRVLSSPPEKMPSLPLLNSTEKLDFNLSKVYQPVLPSRSLPDFMKVPIFVTGTSLMISLWLVATYLRPVPMETYRSDDVSAAADEDVSGPVAEIEVLAEAN